MKAYVTHTGHGGPEVEALGGRAPARAGTRAAADRGGRGRSQPGRLEAPHRHDAYPGQPARAFSAAVRAGGGRTWSPRWVPGVDGFAVGDAVFGSSDGGGLSPAMGGEGQRAPSAGAAGHRRRHPDGGRGHRLRRHPAAGPAARGHRADQRRGRRSRGGGRADRPAPGADRGRHGQRRQEGLRRIAGRHPRGVRPGVADRVRAAAPQGIDGLYDQVGGQALEDVAPLLADRSKLVSAGDRVLPARLGGAFVARVRGQETLTRWPSWWSPGR